MCELEQKGASSPEKSKRLWIGDPKVKKKGGGTPKAGTDCLVATDHLTEQGRSLPALEAP
jgi:hypothetical protein